MRFRSMSGIVVSEPLTGRHYVVVRPVDVCVTATRRAAVVLLLVSQSCFNDFYYIAIRTRRTETVPQIESLNCEWSECSERGIERERKLRNISLLLPSLDAVALHVHTYTKSIVTIDLLADIYIASPKSCPTLHATFCPFLSFSCRVVLSNKRQNNFCCYCFLWEGIQSWLMSY